jgi:hypothetical protein
VRGQQSGSRYHIPDRWSPHRELSYQTGEVEEWGACKPALGFTRLLAGLPTWTLAYEVEKGGRPAEEQSVSQVSSLVLPLVSIIPCCWRGSPLSDLTGERLWTYSTS